MARRTQFSVDLDKEIQQAQDKAEDTVKFAVLGLFRAIVLKTPVDTGHLVYNWQVSVDSPETKERVGVDPDKQNTLQEGQSNIGKWTLKNKMLWIANNVEYAEDIEYGKSKLKAPQGMVRVSLREFDSVFRGAAMKVNTGGKGNRYR